jgi:hypothetical protein
MLQGMVTRTRDGIDLFSSGSNAMGLTKEEVLATGKPRYVGWGKVPGDLKTKTQWSELGMKVKHAAEPAAYVFGGTQHAKPTHYPLYSQAQVEPKQPRRPATPLALTAENIGAALYEVNKAAKRRRDTAKSAYKDRRHSLARNSRWMKEGYYELKDCVLAKAIADGLAHCCGWHKKTDIRQERISNYENATQGADDQDNVDEFDDVGPESEDTWGSRPRPQSSLVEVRRTTYMACFELAGFRFHRIIDQTPAGADCEITDLGQWVSQATARPRNMALQDAEATLRAYLAAGKTGRTQPS